MKLNKIVGFEILKTFSKFRTYIGFITIAILLPVVFALVNKFGFNIQSRVVSQLSESFTFTGKIVNGYLISYYLMTALWIHFPFFIILVAGDIVSTEMSSGTYRILLSRPISRLQLILGKYITIIFYTVLLISFFGIFSILVGRIILGGGNLLVFDKGILILSEKEALYRFFLAYLLAIWIQLSVASLAFLFSTLSKNSVPAIIGSYAFVIFSIIISVLKIDSLEVIKPYLFTTYFDTFFAVFKEPIPYKSILNKSVRSGIFSFIFFSLSVINFSRKDFKC